MKWFNELERKYGKYAINNLMYYIIGIYIVGFVIELFAPEIYDAFLALDVEKILHGQIWRIVTFIIQPPSSSIVFMLFTMYFYYIIGTVLERSWGAFRFNIYFFSGVILHVIAAFIIYFVFHINFNMTTQYINLALFMAFAMENADMEVLLFFILPIKIKWLALVDGIVFALTIVGGYAYKFIYSVISLNAARTLASNGIIFSPIFATCALVSMINFIIFVIIFKKQPYRTQTQRNYQKAYKTAKKAEKMRQAQMNEQGMNGQPGYGAGNTYNNSTNSGSSFQRPRNSAAAMPKHRCAVCKRTEIDSPELTFRYCSKCEGDYEYCNEHLYTHVHVTNNSNR